MRGALEIGCLAATAFSLVSLSVVLIRLLRHRTCLLWVLVSPLQRVVPCIAAKVEALERDFWLPERLAVATSLAYWLLSFSFAIFILAEAHVQKIALCLLLWSTLVSVLLHGVVSPHLNFAIIVQRTSTTAASKMLRLWILAALLLPGLLLILLGIPSEENATTLLLAQATYRWPLFSALALAVLHRFYAEIALGRALRLDALTTLPNRRKRKNSLLSSVSSRRALHLVENCAVPKVTSATTPDDATILAPRKLAFIVVRHRALRFVFWLFWSIVFLAHVLFILYKKCADIALILDMLAYAFVGAATALVLSAKESRLLNIFGKHKSSSIELSGEQYKFRRSEQFSPELANAHGFKKKQIPPQLPSDPPTSWEVALTDSVFDTKSSHAVTSEQVKSIANELQIVTSTLNCAEMNSVRSLLGAADEAGIDAAICNWLPANADIYVIGVQECGCWDELRSALCRALNSTESNHNEYMILGKAAVGSKRVKGHIGVVALVRESLVRSGRVALCTSGQSESDESNGAYAYVPLNSKLGQAVQRGLCSKGTAGIKIRAGEAHLCFLSAHLPADASGKARLRHRNACVALSLLKSAEQLTGWGLPAQATAAAGAQLVSATHLFFLADSNYRCVPPNLEHAVRSPLAAVARAMYLKANGRHEEAMCAWRAATCHDELLRERDAGHVFAAFNEALITFPPTFRRRLGVPLPQSIEEDDFDSSFKLADAYTLLKSQAGQPMLESPISSGQNRPSFSAANTMTSGSCSNDENVLTASRSRLFFVQAPKRISSGLSPSAPTDIQQMKAEADATVEAAYQKARLRLREYMRANGPLEPDELAAAAASCAVAQGLRVPSWTDRILVHSAPSARQFLDIGIYESRESFLASDHRPVVLSCTVRTDSEASVLFDTAQRTGRPGSGFCEMRLTLDHLMVDHLAPPEVLRQDQLLEDLDDIEFETTIAGNVNASCTTNTKDDEAPPEIERVALYFPMPTEDPLAKRRQLRAATSAMHLEQRRSTAFGDHRRRHLEATRAPWASTGDTSVSRNADAVHPRLIRHALIALEARDPKKRAPTRAFAFALIPLPTVEPPKRRASASFSVPLSFCGQHCGVLKGRATLRRTIPRTAPGHLSSDMSSTQLFSLDGLAASPRSDDSSSPRAQRFLPRTVSQLTPELPDSCAQPLENALATKAGRGPTMSAFSYLLSWRARRCSSSSSTSSCYSEDDAAVGGKTFFTAPSSTTSVSDDHGCYDDDVDEAEDEGKRKVVVSTPI